MPSAGKLISVSNRDKVESMSQPEALIATRVADALQGRNPKRFKQLRQLTAEQKQQVLAVIPSDYHLGVANGMIMALSIIDETTPDYVVWAQPSTEVE